MTTGALFYFPTMHPEFAPPSVPEGLLFVPCGITTLSADAHPAVRAFADSLPFAPREAAQVLADMLGIAAERGIESLAMESFRPTEPGSAREEIAAIDAFAAGGTIPPGKPDTGPDAARLLEAERTAHQKLLLLAYSLEEQIAGIREVEQRLQRSQEALGALLRDDPEPDTGLEMEFSLPGKLLLRAVTTFLPEGAALYADDPAIAREWRELSAFIPADDALLDAYPTLRDMRPLVGLLQPAPPDKPGHNHLKHMVPLFIPAEGIDA